MSLDVPALHCTSPKDNKLLSCIARPFDSLGNVAVTALTDVDGTKEGADKEAPEEELRLCPVESVSEVTAATGARTSVYVAPLTRQHFVHAIRWLSGVDDWSPSSDQTCMGLFELYLVHLARVIPADQEQDGLNEFIASRDWRPCVTCLDIWGEDHVEDAKNGTLDALVSRRFINENVAKVTGIAATALDAPTEVAALDCLLTGCVPMTAQSELRTEVRRYAMEHSFEEEWVAKFHLYTDGCDDFMAYSYHLKAVHLAHKNAVARQIPHGIRQFLPRVLQKLSIRGTRHLLDLGDSTDADVPKTGLVNDKPNPDVQEWVQEVSVAVIDTLQNTTDEDRRMAPLLSLTTLLRDDFDGMDMKEKRTQLFQRRIKKKRGGGVNCHFDVFPFIMADQQLSNFIQHLRQESPGRYNRTPFTAFQVQFIQLLLWSHLDQDTHNVILEGIAGEEPVVEQESCAQEEDVCLWIGHFVTAVSSAVRFLAPGHGTCQCRVLEGSGSLSEEARVERGANYTQIVTALTLKHAIKEVMTCLTQLGMKPASTSRLKKLQKFMTPRPFLVTEKVRKKLDDAQDKKGQVAGAQGKKPTFGSKAIEERLNRFGRPCRDLISAAVQTHACDLLNRLGHSHDVDLGDLQKQDLQIQQLVPDIEQRATELKTGLQLQVTALFSSDGAHLLTLASEILPHWETGVVNSLYDLTRNRLSKETPARKKTKPQKTKTSDAQPLLAVTLEEAIALTELVEELRMASENQVHLAKLRPTEKLRKDVQELVDVLRGKLGERELERCNWSAWSKRREDKSRESAQEQVARRRKAKRPRSGAGGEAPSGLGSPSQGKGAGGGRGKIMSPKNLERRCKARQQTEQVAASLLTLSQGKGARGAQGENPERQCKARQAEQVATSSSLEAERDESQSSPSNTGSPLPPKKKASQPHHIRGNPFVHEDVDVQGEASADETSESDSKDLEDLIDNRTDSAAGTQPETHFAIQKDRSPGSNPFLNKLRDLELAHLPARDVRGRGLGAGCSPGRCGGDSPALGSHAGADACSDGHGSPSPVATASEGGGPGSDEELQTQ